MGTLLNPIIPVLQTYTPTITGTSDNPTATYSTQIGRYFTIGKLCYVEVVIVTTTMTKSTLTDAVQIQLPVAAANVSGAVQHLTARVENATAVLVGSLGYTTPNSTAAQVRQIVPTAASVIVTYAVLSLGVLTNTCTFILSGLYETV